MYISCNKILFVFLLTFKIIFLYWNQYLIFNFIVMFYIITTIVFIVFLISCGVMVIATHVEPISPEDSEKKEENEKK